MVILLYDPFLENDDARALMGITCSARLCLCGRAPLVGTGIEYRVAHDSGVVITSKGRTVERVTADEIVVKGTPARRMSIT